MKRKKLSKSDGPQAISYIDSLPASNHFKVGESVKRAHTAPEKIVGLFIYDDGQTLLTLRADDGSVSHVLPVALNH